MRDVRELGRFEMPCGAEVILHRRYRADNGHPVEYYLEVKRGLVVVSDSNTAAPDVMWDEDPSFNRAVVMIGSFGNGLPKLAEWLMKTVNAEIERIDRADEEVAA